MKLVQNRFTISLNWNTFMKYFYLIKVIQWDFKVDELFIVGFKFDKFVLIWLYQKFYMSKYFSQKFKF